MYFRSRFKTSATTRLRLRMADGVWRPERVLLPTSPQLFFFEEKKKKKRKKKDEKKNRATWRKRATRRVSFRFVFCFVSFRFVSFRFVSFRETCITDID